MNQSSPRIALVLSAFAVVALSACSTPTEGSPVPAPSASDSSSSETPQQPTGDPFNGTKACALLDKAAKETDPQLPAGKPDTVGSDNGCLADKPQYATVSLDLHGDLGIADINGDKSKQMPGDIKGRTAIQVPDKATCLVYMQVTKTSRAMVTTTMSKGTPEEVCAYNEKLATAIEPLLPPEVKLGG